MSRNSVDGSDVITQIVDDYIKARRSGKEVNINYYLGRYPRFRKPILRALQVENSGKLLFDTLKAEEDPIFSQEEIDMMAEALGNHLRLSEGVKKARNTTLTELSHKAENNDSFAIKTLKSVYQWLVCDVNPCVPFFDIDSPPVQTVLVRSATTNTVMTTWVHKDRCFIPTHIRVRVESEKTLQEIPFQLERFTVDDRGRMELYIRIPEDIVNSKQFQTIRIFFEHDSIRLPVGDFSLEKNRITIELPLIYSSEQISE